MPQSPGVTCTVVTGTVSPATRSPAKGPAFARTDTGSKLRNQFASDARGGTWAGGVEGTRDHCELARALLACGLLHGAANPSLLTSYLHLLLTFALLSDKTKLLKSCGAASGLYPHESAQVRRRTAERGGACRRRCSATLCRRDLGASSRRVLLDRKVLRGLSVKLVPLNKAAQCPNRVGE